MIRLRPHHILCLRFYRGEGYSREFTSNTDAVLSRLKKGENAVIVNGADDLCAACPYHDRGACAEKEKTDAYDAKTAGLLGVKEGDIFRFEELIILSDEKIFGAGTFGGICSDCEWSYICRSNV